MSLPIRYSLRAWNEEIELLDYIVKEFGQNKAEEIFNKIEASMDLISKTSVMYIESRKRKNLRKFVFSKQTSIYYSIKKDHIEIVSFRPNRKNPTGFKL